MCDRMKKEKKSKREVLLRATFVIPNDTIVSAQVTHVPLVTLRPISTTETFPWDQEPFEKLYPLSPFPPEEPGSKITVVLVLVLVLVPFYSLTPKNVCGQGVALSEGPGIIHCCWGLHC